MNFQLKLPTRASGYGRRNVPQDSAHHLNSIYGNVPTSRQLSRVPTHALSTGTEDSEHMDSWFLNYFILNFHKIYIIILSDCHPRAFPVSNVTIIKRKLFSIYNCPGAKTDTNQIKMGELLRTEVYFNNFMSFSF